MIYSTSQFREDVLVGTPMRIRTENAFEQEGDNDALAFLYGEAVRCRRVVCHAVWVG